MKLYKISQLVNTGYDTFSSAVVAAKDKKAAQNTHPNGRLDWNGKESLYGEWASAEDVKVELIGTAVEGTKAGVICASFHAG